MITKAERNRWREELKLTNPFWADTREWLALDTIDDMEAEIAEQAKEIERLKAENEDLKGEVGELAWAANSNRGA